MHFGLSEDQAAIRDSVRGFARAKLAPGYLERAKSDQFPWDAHREIAGLGVFGLLAGEEFTPLPGEDFVAAGLAVEELAYADTAQQTEETFGCAVTTVYGSTDGGVITVTRTTDPVAKRRTTVGRPIPGGEVVLRDPLGDPVPDGTAGEVTWRTPTKSFGYLNDDERTGAMFRGDGWFHSGDLGSLDEDGYLSITGRSKDLIIRGGQNISPLEIEQIVARHGAVSEVAVVGIPDPVFGERTCACVVLRPGVAGLALDELTGYMQAQEIAPYKLPERLEIFAELPRTAGGKLSKVTLRSEVVERIAAR